MFVESNIDDVVPTGRVVALETLVHAGVLLARELLGDHREMLHEVTRRRLMTLYAFFGPGGRVLVADHGPCLHRVALRAVASEPFEVRILAIVAGGAIEGFVRGAVIELFGASNAEPRLESVEGRGAVGVRTRCALE